MNVTKYIDAMANVVAEFERRKIALTSIPQVQRYAQAARKAIRKIAKDGRHRLDELIRVKSVLSKPRWALRWSKPPTHPPKLPAILAAAESIALGRVELVESRHNT